MKQHHRDRILYVGFYDTAQNSTEARVLHLSATNKMDYICTALNTAGREVLIVSPSHTKNRRTYRGRLIQLTDGVSLRLFPTFPWGNRLQRAVSILASQVFLFLFLLFNTHRNETVVVYHSLALQRAVRYAKRIRGFRMLLEVEEVYQDVGQVSPSTARSEDAAFLAAEAFIFSTELLDGAINKNRNPMIVSHGTYQVQPDRGLRPSDRKIHVVYAGIIDSHKGASVAVAAAAHLDNRYHVHIIGHGNKRDIERLENQIEKVAADTECGLTYDGLLVGGEFLDFLQKCHIGLSTQLPVSTFNETSFPSKVLSYLANGLAVVSVRIRAVEMSRVAGAITFYDGQDPSSVANAIRAVKFPRTQDSRALIRDLDVEFVNDLRSLLDEMARG